MWCLYGTEAHGITSSCDAFSCVRNVHWAYIVIRTELSASTLVLVVIPFIHLSLITMSRGAPLNLSSYTDVDIQVLCKAPDKARVFLEHPPNQHGVGLTLV